MPKTKEGLYLNIKEAAGELRCSVKQIRRLIGVGALPHFRFANKICFRPAALEEYILQLESESMTLFKNELHVPVRGR